MVAEGGGTDGGGPFEALALGGGAPPLFDDAVLSQRLADPALPVAWSTGERLATLRGELSLRGLTGWMRWAAAGEELDDWDRAVGVETSTAVPRMPFIRLPAVRLVAGASRVLDGPGEDDTRFFLSLDLEP